MKIKFAVDDPFYLVCHDWQSPLLTVMDKAGFVMPNATRFDEYDLPCVALYNKDDLQPTDTCIILNSMVKFSKWSEIILFKTVTGTFKINDLYDDLSVLDCYISFGLVESIYSIEFENDDVSSPIKSSNKIDLECFKNIVQKSIAINDLDNSFFEIKFTIPFCFKKTSIDVVNRQVVAVIKTGYEMSCIEKID